MKRYQPYKFEEGGISLIPKYSDNIVMVNTEKGKSIYNKITKKLNIDGGSFEVYDLGKEYLVAIADENYEKVIKKIKIKKSDSVSKDLNELVGELKAQYGSFKDVKKDSQFKKLSDGDQEYVLDELKAEGTFKD